MDLLQELLFNLVTAIFMFFTGLIGMVIGRPSSFTRHEALGIWLCSFAVVGYGIILLFNHNAIPPWLSEKTRFFYGLV